MNGQKKNSMKRVHKIMAHPAYREYVEKTAEWEKERRFCGHGFVHFLDVARIAQILNLQENRKPIRKDWVYGAALLHDIGRFIQYENGTDHAKASAVLALEILKDCGYSEAETVVITRAIANHRNKEIKDKADLDGILYRADKASRPCYRCEAEAECDWKRKKKNRKLEI